MDTTILWQLVKANWALTGIFFIDVLLRIIPLSASEFFHEGWAPLNVILIGFGIAEAVIKGTLGVWGIQQNLTLRSIRSLRVLRGLVFIQASRPMMSIASIIVQAAISYAAIAVLIVLFWIVFAIIGMNVFGQIELDLTYLGYQGYPNFSSFLSSMVISFQVLTLENYQQTMYSLVRASGWGSVSWFLIWIVLGKYTFLSLFLAVTLEAFDDTGEEPTGFPPLDDKRARRELYLENEGGQGPRLDSTVTATGTPGTLTTQTSRNRTPDLSVGKPNSEGGLSIFTDFSQRTGRLFFGSGSMGRRGENKSSSQGSSKRWPSVANIMGSIKPRGLKRSGSANASNIASPSPSPLTKNPLEDIRRLTLSKSKSDSESDSRVAAAEAALIGTDTLENPSTSEISLSRTPGPSRFGLKQPQESSSIKLEMLSHYMKQSKSLGRFDSNVSNRGGLGKIFEDPSDCHEGEAAAQDPMSPGDISIGREGLREPRKLVDRVSPSTPDGPLIPSAANEDVSPFAIARWKPSPATPGTPPPPGSEGYTSHQGWPRRSCQLEAWTDLQVRLHSRA